MNNEISREDLFEKIDKLKIRIFDTEDALKSAEIRIQELNKCNDYANEELERYKNIVDEFINKFEDFIETMEYEKIYHSDLKELLNKLKELKGSDE